MKRNRVFLLVIFCLALVQLAFAQTSTQAASALPRLVRFGGTAKGTDGSARTGVVGITFALYAEQTGGAPLWQETQNVTADSGGRYSALLGATKTEGLPAELFTSEQAHWVGVQVEGQPEQPRVLLVSAPYALKAGDAETIGGLPPSAFVLAVPSLGSAASGPAASPASAAAPAGSTAAVTGSGTADYIARWTTATKLGSSALFQSGTGPGAQVGINTTTPTATLDIKGNATVEGPLTLPPGQPATVEAAYASNVQNLVASAYNSSTSAAENQTFQWQAYPTGTNTATPSGMLTLAFGEGATAPALTGLSVNGKGIFTFAAGQTFPGTGAGTVTSVGSGAGLTGGPITSSGTLSIATGGVGNTMLANSSLSVLAGADLTGGGTVALGGSTTLSLDTTKVPQLAAASNTFTGSQTVDGSVNMIGDTRVDYNGLNTGTYTPGIRFGSGNTGEGISSNRAGTANKQGIDLYTDFTARLSVTNSGSVGIGTTAPGYTLDVRGAGNFSSGVNGTSSTAGVSAVSGNNSATSGSGTNGVYGSTSSPAGAGVVGLNSSSGGYGLYGQTSGYASGSAGVYGTATNSSAGAPTYGVYGSTSSTFAGSAGVYGTALPCAGVCIDLTYGVYGTTSGDRGVGVAGTQTTLSATANAYGYGAGVWGDTNGQQYPDTGLLGTADDAIAVYAVNNGATPTLFALNNDANGGSGALVFKAASGISSCTINVSGDLNCTGTITPTAQTTAGREVNLYGVASPENWFEDFGSGQLSGGSAKIPLDPAFASTVNSGETYHVFLTPRGECEGLYVAATTASGFEVRELHHGTSNISFDYRIIAKRRGYERVRLEDVTERMNAARQRQAEMEAKRTAARISAPAHPTPR